MSRNEITLHGCTPIPLAGYLKALGILRIVSQQADSNAQGWWERDVFHLRCRMKEDELTRFFIEDYQSTPIVGPWGARSGFFAGSSEKSAREALDSIAASDTGRLEWFRTIIEATRTALEKHNVTEKPEPGAPKDALMRILRNELPDSMLEWLDCVYVLLEDRTAFPPVLGTGGNEGSGSYTSAYAQAVVEVIIQRKWDSACRSTLFDTAASGVTSSMLPGHFDPGATGGPNAGSGFSGQTTLNPWTLLLMLEGTLMLASASTRKIGSDTRNAAAFPFSVESVGAGYGSSSISDEASRRPELWLPRWKAPTTCSELTQLFSEGRANVEGRPARTAIDFARAVASLGVDRGISAFDRYGFQLRNGDLSNFSVHLGVLRTSDSPAVHLHRELDNGNWLDRFRRTATGKTSTARAAAALRQVESAIIEVCQQADGGSAKRKNTNLLIALGNAEATIAGSPKLRESDYPVPPVPLLSPEWLRQCYDSNSASSTEFRLAAALASVGFRRNSVGGPMRRHLEPIDVEQLSKKYARASWADHANDPAIVWSGGSLVRNLIAVLQRRLIDVGKSGSEGFTCPVSGCCPARLDDIARFIDAGTDDRLIEAYLRGLMLIDWKKVTWKDIPWMDYGQRGDWQVVPSAAWCLLKLCLLPHGIPAADGSQNSIDVRLQPQIFRRAGSGQLWEATQLAARRLTASGLRPAVEIIHGSPEIAARTTAALMFPIYGDLKRSRTDITRVRDRVLESANVEQSSLHAENA